LQDVTHAGPDLMSRIDLQQASSHMQVPFDS